MLAVACDPAERLRGTIAFPGDGPKRVVVIEGEVSVAQVSGNREPLLPGERLTLSVTKPSATAQLRVRVASGQPYGPRSVVLDQLVDGTTVTIGQDLDLIVTRRDEIAALGPAAADAVLLPPAVTPKGSRPASIGASTLLRTAHVRFQGAVRDP